MNKRKGLFPIGEKDSISYDLGNEAGLRMLLGFN